MKRTLLALLGFLLLATPAAQAQFTYMTNNGTITITGYTGSGGAVAIPSTINNLTVTSIGNDAFYTSSLTSVTIPNSVTGIGASAFDHCLSLTSVKIGDGVTNIGTNAFFYCFNLRSVTLGNRLAKIGDTAFEDCSALVGITIPNSVTSIGDFAFSSTGLTSVNIPSSVNSIGTNAFYYCLALTNAMIGDGVTDIGDYAFEECYSLKRVTIGTNATSIGFGAFSGCPSLTDVTIPNSVTSIGGGAFEDTGLTDVTIPASVTNIGYSPFQECPGLTAITVDAQNSFYSSVNGVLFDRSQVTLIQYPGGVAGSYTIPGTVTKIGDYAFAVCSSLTGITIPGSVNSIGEGAFNYCTYLAGVTIPNSVTNIGDAAFAGCYSLPAITVNAGDPDYISTAGVLFNGSQTTLIQYPERKVGTSYTIPDGVTNIGDWAFSASSLTNVTIPGSVTSIGEYSFLECSSLTSIYLHANAPTLGEDVFSLDNHATVYYLPGSSGWGSTFGGLPAVMLNAPVPAGSLNVTIIPAAAITAGAQWQVDGGIPQPSGATVLGLSVGDHTLGFSAIGVGTTPLSQTVTILANKTTTEFGIYEEQGNPKLTITSPKAGQTVSNTLLLVPGTVTDRVAVDDVYYQLNGGSWTPATTTNSWSNWTAGVTLIPGANTISAYAQDASGSFSPTNTVRFQYILSAMLRVQTNGLGSITPNDNGKLLAINGNYTLTASPDKNWSFSNWVASGSENFVSGNPILKFDMQSNLVLEANFVPNPFIPLHGTFNGLFLDSNDVTEASSGFFTLALTSNGTFTGKIMTSGSTYSLPTTTAFDVGGQVQFTVPTKQNNLTFDLQLDVSDPASEQITGTVSNGIWTAGLTADRAVFSASAIKATNYEGRYTLAIAGSDDSAASPGGFGCAALSISSAGLITMAGNLADATAISQSVSVSKDGRWPFYASYAPPPAGNGGAAFSWIVFSNQPATALGGTMYWFRPAGKVPTLYQSGFTNTAPIIGSAYNSADKPLLALTNGQVILEGGNFTLTNQITLSPSDTIIVLHTAGNTNKLALTINKTNGIISGSFANPSNSRQTIAVKGVLLQNQTNAAGYFPGTNQSGAFLLENP